ncbi:hypothetical protein SNE40_004105 [Patella caerulea]|uniref:Uncharacterized protein n=1 Tax=Patella caerulea TaxID=87958 RepID=A0AAN8KB52_PATCE
MRYAVTPGINLSNWPLTGSHPEFHRKSFRIERLLFVGQQVGVHDAPDTVVGFEVLSKVDIGDEQIESWGIINAGIGEYSSPV